MVVFFADLLPFHLLHPTHIVQTSLLIVLPQHICLVFLPSFLFDPKVLTKTIDLFLQLQLLPHCIFLTFFPDTDVQIFKVFLLCRLFRQRLLT